MNTLSEFGLASQVEKDKRFIVKWKKLKPDTLDWFLNKVTNTKMRRAPAKGDTQLSLLPEEESDAEIRVYKD